MKGVANDEAGDIDDRVIVGPKAHLKRLNGLSKPRTEEAETRDYRSPNSEADPQPARTLISRYLLYIERKRVEGKPRLQKLDPATHRGWNLRIIEEDERAHYTSRLDHHASRLDHRAHCIPSLLCITDVALWLGRKRAGFL